MIATQDAPALILDSWRAATLSSMNVSTERQIREFVEKLAVPERTPPPQCPLCSRRHPLEERCAQRPAVARR
jgi:hypothetical protein